MDLGYVVNVAAGREVVPRPRTPEPEAPTPVWWQGRHENAIELPGLGNRRHRRSGERRRHGRHREPDESLHAFRELCAALAGLRMARERPDCPFERLARRCQ